MECTITLFQPVCQKNYSLVFFKENKYYLVLYGKRNMKAVANKHN